VNEARGSAAGPGGGGSTPADDAGTTEPEPARPEEREAPAGQAAEPAGAEPAPVAPPATAEAEQGDKAEVTATEDTPAPEVKPTPEGDGSTTDLDETPIRQPRSRLLSARFWGASPAGLLIGLLLALLGFGLVIQLQNNTVTGLASRRQDDLVRILDDLSSREERLRQQLASLQAARDRLSAGGDSSAAALAEAHRRSAELGILAGTVPAQGKGIELTISDPGGRLSADNLLDTIEELRGAGAEAIQVGTARIGLSSAFTQDTAGSPIVVDGIILSAPYVILAIGDGPTMATAMNIPGGVVDTVRQVGANAQIRQPETVQIRALRRLEQPQYAQPAPSTGN